MSRPISRILAAVDQSTLAPRVVRYATEMASSLGCSLTVLLVVEPFLPPASYAPPAPGHVISGVEDIAQAQAWMADLEPAMQSVPHETLVLSGAAVDTILQVARDRQVQYIVMAPHGRRGLSHLLLGSTTEELIRRCSLPVIILPTMTSVKL